VAFQFQRKLQVKYFGSIKELYRSCTTPHFLASLRFLYPRRSCFGQGNRNFKVHLILSLILSMSQLMFSSHKGLSWERTPKEDIFEGEILGEVISMFRVVFGQEFAIAPQICTIAGIRNQPESTPLCGNAFPIHIFTNHLAKLSCPKPVELGFLPLCSAIPEKMPEGVASGLEEWRMQLQDTYSCVHGCTLFPASAQTQLLFLL
jgi:hypothetical protein